MDDTLKRRLVGAAVLLFAALALTALLPDPDRRHGEGREPVVAYDLRTGQPLNLPAEAPPPPVKLKPVEIGELDPAPQPDAGKPVEQAASGKPVEPKPAPGPVSAVTPTKPAARPSLKVDETFGVKGGDAWYVQIGSFASKENARTEQMKLAKLGLPAILQAISVDRKLWYRVRVGPYPAEAPAQQALTTVRAHGYAAAKVARPEPAAN